MALVEPLSALVRALGVVLLVVDSVVPATFGLQSSVKDAETAADVVRAANSICCRSILIAHLPKDAPDAKTPYGSIYFHKLPRLTWRAARNAKNRSLVTLTNEKNNDGDTLPPVTLRFVFSPERGLERIENVRPKLTLDALVEVMRSTGSVRGADLMDAAIKAGFEVSKSRFYELLAKAKQAKKVKQADHLYSIADSEPDSADDD